MTDREKVIKGLECIAGYIVFCANCKYSDVNGSGRGDRCKRDCAKDALALLKAQEPDETRLVRHYSRPNVYADLWLHCEKCGGVVDNRYRPKFCPECGRKVKWE